MRRLGTLLMSVCVLFALSGCGGEESSSAAGGNGPPKPPPDLEKLFKKPAKGAGKKAKAAAKPASEDAPAEKN